MSSLNSVGLAFLDIAPSLPAIAVGGVGSEKLVIEATQGCDVKGFQQAHCRGDVTIAQGDVLMRSDVVELQQLDTGARLKAFSLGAKPMEFR